MAYAFRVSPAVVATVNGTSFRSWMITETGVLTASEWSIQDVPLMFTIWLFESAVLQSSSPPPSSTHEINPLLGTKASWIEDSIDHIAANLKARKAIRNGCSLRVNAPLNTLYGRSKPTLGGQSIITEQDAVPVIVSRITITEGS